MRMPPLRQLSVKFRGTRNWVGSYTAVPYKTPTPAVIPMASAPQKVTRITLGMTLAPPARGQRTQKREEDQRGSGHEHNQGRRRG